MILPSYAVLVKDQTLRLSNIQYNNRYRKLYILELNRGKELKLYLKKQSPKRIHFIFYLHEQSLKNDGYQQVLYTLLS